MSDVAEQRTSEWHEARSGKFTGSKFSDVIARNKRTGEPLKAYHDLIWKIVTERMSGYVDEGPDGYALMWGRDVEPFAREAYELETGNIVTQTGFIVHPSLDFVGCSPDGLIDENGGLEIKCPKSPEVHLKRFLEGVPEEYIPQIQGCMWVTGRLWWDFVSYHPRMKESHRIYIKRVYKDDAYIAKLEAEVIEAEDKVLEIMWILE